MTSLQLIFIVLAVITLGSGLAVVTNRNLFHAALAMMLSFFGVAGFYVLLEAPFPGCRAALGLHRRDFDSDHLRHHDDPASDEYRRIAIQLTMGWRTDWCIAHAGSDTICCSGRILAIWYRNYC